jgi:hypothetical protein
MKHVGKVSFHASVLLIGMTLIAGCASSPVPMGQDTYMLSDTGAWSWSSGAALKGGLFREADAFCRGQAKHLMPISAGSNDGSFSQFAHADIQFRCLREGDPELGRPTLEAVPNVRIENRTR